MRRIVAVFVIVILLVIIVHCQGGGENSSSSSGSSGYSRSGTCTGKNCGSLSTTRKVIVFVIVPGILGLIGICACCTYLFKGKPLRSNLEYINKAAEKSNETELLNNKLFPSGLWTSRYFQYKEWHGPHVFSLIFDPQHSKVLGTGRDDVGMYSIDGVYSTKTRRIGLTKKYQIGTGNPLENVGHSVTVQVEWNPKESQFEGKWYVDAEKFSGEDKFELKLDKNQELPTDKNFEQYGTPF